MMKRIIFGTILALPLAVAFLPKQASAEVVPQPHVVSPPYVAPQPHMGSSPSVAPRPQFVSPPYVTPLPYVVPQQVWIPDQWVNGPTGPYWVPGRYQSTPYSVPGRYRYQ